MPPSPGSGGPVKISRCLVYLTVATGLIGAGPRLRPAEWATPVINSRLDNWYRIDAKVYRSAQPDSEGMKDAERFGIRNVLNLRNHHSDDDEIEGTTLKILRVKMEAGDLKDGQIVAALRAIRNAEGPILVHCWHGSDRTGAVIAMYRIIFLNWNKAAAIDEMVNGGYGFHGIYASIVTYIQKCDVGKIRAQVYAP
jgi:tyrosine-protein phosphatase SIW14